MRYSSDHRGMGKSKAVYGSRREASYRAMCEAFAFELGCKLVERDGETFVLHPDESEEPLPVDVASRHRWFEVWKLLKDRVPRDAYDRILRDAAFGRL
jgi:hypothetical protein